ncbi:MAG: HNH endonuclease [Novosphingobium sp.]|jgi:hypothetical protein|nr:HNH endonuclease [Novosphingobium sp.]
MSGETMLDFRERAMSLVDYEPETGLFRWKVKRNGYGGGTYPGKVAGTVHKDGYIIINFNARLWRAHRLAFLFMTGAVPPKGMEVDHVNGDRADNRWDNLRSVTRRQNNYNLGVSKKNVSGTKGVSWVASRGQWLARIKADGKVVHLGQFDEKQDAIAARRDGEAKYHGEFARKAA